MWTLKKNHRSSKNMRDNRSKLFVLVLEVSKVLCRTLRYRTKWHHYRTPKWYLLVVGFLVKISPVGSHLLHHPRVNLVEKSLPPLINAFSNAFFPSANIAVLCFTCKGRISQTTNESAIWWICQQLRFFQEKNMCGLWKKTGFRSSTSCSIIIPTLDVGRKRSVPTLCKRNYTWAAWTAFCVEAKLKTVKFAVSRG